MVINIYIYLCLFHKYPNFEAGRTLCQFQRMISNWTKTTIAIHYRPYPPHLWWGLGLDIWQTRLKEIFMGLPFPQEEFYILPLPLDEILTSWATASILQLEGDKKAQMQKVYMTRIVDRIKEPALNCLSWSYFLNIHKAFYYISCYYLIFYYLQPNTLTGICEKTFL